VIVEGLFLPGPQRPGQAIDLGHVNCLGPAVYGRFGIPILPAATGPPLRIHHLQRPLEQP